MKIVFYIIIIKIILINCQGGIYSTGHNIYGQLGVGSPEITNSSVLVRPFKGNCNWFYARFYSSFAICNSKFLAFGYNNYVNLVPKNLLKNKRVYLLSQISKIIL
jgi:alpha-tubulin suppressor-like RCC1 family protein